MKASFNPLLTAVVAAAVGAVLGILAVSIGTSTITNSNTKPANVEQDIIVYGER
ncbi:MULTISPECIES: hypothetical protein [Micromonospora]|uniref:DUF2613 family protein n=1 Tax=Micromonospora parathelypteridis TaxID=1839617 RepID=A0A840W1F3_9ACTN|nr:hypothetical protein [Micromonospora parathelypteridis]MBB5478119.1 hypothetical protein [Micromonospora parathelypteridis]GGO13481.1 hypothetical protein GCM10011576_23640 [Micromonospora parathelypteridis]